MSIHASVSLKPASVRTWFTHAWQMQVKEGQQLCEQRCWNPTLHFLCALLLRSSLARTIFMMSGDVKICPKCNKTTLEPTLDCVVPPEMIGLLQQPIPDGSDPRVMPYFCLSCRRVELYPVGT